jgi:hypothetical protein
MTKISTAVFDVAAPFIDALSDGASDEARHDAIEMGVTVWNALAMLRRGDDRMWQGLTDYFRTLPEPESATMALIVAESVRRKNTRHPDDIRLVRSWKLTIRPDGTATLRAEASAPPAWAAAHSKRQDG